MMVQAGPVAVSVWHLFCHDHVPAHPFADDALAAALNRHLDEANAGRYDGVRVVPPDECGLSRWQLHWTQWQGGEHDLHERVYTPAEVRRLVPADVAAWLDHLDGLTLELTGT